MKRTIIGQQGEVRIYLVDEIPQDAVSAEIEKDGSGRSIISHSEKGHHHVIDDPDVTVLERVTSGMKTLYAIVKSPAALIQTAQRSHGSHALAVGTYMFRIDREYDPFRDQIRVVRD